MLREAINYLVDLGKLNEEIDTIEINGRIYTERNLKEVKVETPRCRCFEFTNLTALIENIKLHIEKGYHELPLIVKVEENEVHVLSSYDKEKVRENIFLSRAEVPSISFGRYISVEEMIIQLQTCFKDNDNKTNLIKLISKLSKDQKITVEDDGITQKVVASEGVSTVANVTVPPLVKLIPQRTFYEVEQPEQIFLFRVDKNCNVALFDAAGDVWKYQCQEAIRAYLIKQLNNEYVDGKVVIG